MRYDIVFNGIPLPKPLTDKEFDFYFDRFKSGDMDARDVLIIHNIRLVLAIVQRRFGDTQYELEELVSVGIIGLINAIDTYDRDKNDKLSGYASKCIITIIIKYLVKNDKYNELNAISLDETMLLEDDSSLFGEIVGYTASLEDEFIDRELRVFEYSLINDVLKNLNVRDREIIMMYSGFKDGRKYKQREIATVLGVSRARVGKIISCTLNKMKQRILFEKRIMEFTQNDVTSKRLTR